MIVANVRELRVISHSDRKSDQVDAEKLARFARLRSQNTKADCSSHRCQQEALTLIRARNLVVRLRTGAVNAVRGLAKSCGYRLPAPCIHIPFRRLRSEQQNRLSRVHQCDDIVVSLCQ